VGGDVAEVGRRDRKRQETRDRIAEAARTLFGERGFDGVTVAEIAEAADVSEQTVYNHFPTKEDLVLWRRGTFEAELLEAISGRAPEESALSAFHRFLTQPRGGQAPDDAAVRERIDVLLRTAMGSRAPGAHEGTIMDSPGLRARERSIVAGYTTSLAAMLAEDTGAGPDDIEPQVAAAAMLGVTQALIDHARRRVVEGASSSALTRELRARADRAVQVLEAGLGDYAVRTRR
jgi:AcrR family transcriptional regulator